jgi:hypothetical protein
MSAFPDNFFKALGKEGGDTAMALLREAAFDSGLKHKPSPWAQPFFNKGEWESSKSLVSLTLVDTDACYGLMVTLLSPRGVSYTRFCGKSGSKCEIHSHQASKLRPDMQIPGWYLSGGSGRQGSVWEIRFSRHEDGGPISMAAALHLQDSDQPFRMSFGQWLFVHAEWASARVETLPSDDSEDHPLILEVDTDLSDPPDTEPIRAKDVVGKSPAWPSGRNDKFPPLPDKAVRPSANPDSHEHQQLRRLVNLERQIAALNDELRSCREVAQDAHDECWHHQWVMANLSSCLDMMERLLKPILTSQRDEAKYRAFVTSVEHALFNPQGEIRALQLQVKSVQN